MSDVTLPEDSQKVLARIDSWTQWHHALECAESCWFDKETGSLRRSPSIVYCADTSEVVEFAAPKSIASDSNPYPTQLDLSVRLLLSPPRAVEGSHVFILAPHAKELQELQKSWQERVESVVASFRELRSAVHSAPTLTNDSDAQNRVAYEEFISLMVNQGSQMLAHWFADMKYAERLAVLQKIGGRIRILQPKEVGAPQSWTYQRNTGRVSEWFLAFQRVAPAGLHPRNHLVDAIALDFVESLNASLEGEFVVVLVTHSKKVLTALATDPELNGRLRRNGVPLVQPTEVLLANRLCSDFGTEWLRLESKRLSNLMELREHVTRENELHAADVNAHEMLIGRCVQSLDELDTASGQWRILERILEDRPDDPTSFRGLQRVIRGADRKELRGLLQERAAALRYRTIALLNELGTHFPELPGEDFAHQVQGTFATLPSGSDVLASGSRFQSQKFHVFGAGPQGLLSRITQALSSWNDDPSSDRGSTESRLEQLMIECQAAADEEPEYSLLLAAAFRSQRRWFETYASAAAGVDRLRRARSTRPISNRVFAELMYAEAVGYHNWMLEDVPTDSGLALERFRPVLRLYLDAGDALRNSSDTALDPARDARWIRDIAALLGEMRECGVASRLTESELSRLSKIAELETDSVDELTVGLAKRAWHLCGGEASQSYFLNTYLYSLVEADSNISTEERTQLCDQLRSWIDEEPNFADTIAWHYYKMALREPDIERRATMMEVSNKMITEALRAVPTANSYHRRLLESHRQTIVTSSSPRSHLAID